MEDKTFRRLAGSTLLAWLGVIGFDFLLHASLLAPLYVQPSPFLLAPERAFALIPLGYLSFLVIVILIAWLMVRLEITTMRAGLIFGLELGALLWGGLILSLISISSAPLPLMVGWFFWSNDRNRCCRADHRSRFGSCKLEKVNNLGALICSERFFGWHSHPESLIWIKLVYCGMSSYTNRKFTSVTCPGEGKPAHQHRGCSGSHGLSG